MDGGSAGPEGVDLEPAEVICIKVVVGRDVDGPGVDVVFHYKKTPDPD